ncbi:MAG: hypothetical protein ACHQ0J_09330 [Candidatus Dormibacterales bacterium]
MPASWVAASVRAKLLQNRRLGEAGAVAVAGSGSLRAGMEMLMDSAYGTELNPGMTLEAAQRQIAITTLWQLRVLAGWLPPGGSEILRPLAAWFEIANIEERLSYLSGGTHAVPYELGGLATAWPLVSTATTSDRVRELLARSHWGDPGSSEPSAMMTVLRLRWAAWVAGTVPSAEVWAASAAALLAARVRFAAPILVPLPATTRAVGLPRGWAQAASLSDLRAMMPRWLSWVLEGVAQASELWTAEARWWSRVSRDARQTIVRSRHAPAAIVAVAALLGYDAWLARGALASAARGRPAREAFDAVA